MSEEYSRFHPLKQNPMSVRDINTTIERKEF